MLQAQFNIVSACGHSAGQGCVELALPHLTELRLMAPGEKGRESCSFPHLPGGLPALRTLVVNTWRAVHDGCLERLTQLEALDVTEFLGPQWRPLVGTREQNCLTQVCVANPAVDTDVAWSAFPSHPCVVKPHPGP